MKHSVTVATCCYDKDWKLLLSPGYLAKQFEKFGYDFNERILIINTDNERETIEKHAEIACENGDIDCYYFASDYKEEFCKKFKITDFLFEESFDLFKNSDANPIKSIAKNIYRFYFKKKGKAVHRTITKRTFDCSGYALGPLCALYTAKSEYLLYFTEDCAIHKDRNEWIDNGIHVVESSNEFIAARPIDDDLDSMYLDKYDQIDDFYVCYMFTDRMFLTKIETMANIDFNAKSSGNYPAYGGAGFEAKVFNYMHLNDKRIIISKNQKYLHEYPEYMNGITESTRA